MSKNKHLEKMAWFDGDVDIQRFDVVRHPMIEKWNNTALSFFWRPEEVDVTKDKADFESLEDHEKFIFWSNLQRQILLDTVQGRDPLEAFLPLASSPENENAISNWAFQETIHSRSYTHILRNVLNDPSELFDSVLENEEILGLQKDLNKYYEPLIRMNRVKALLDDPQTDLTERRALDQGYSLYEHKKAFWLALMAANALEGVRFYVSFACSWAFMEMKNKMEGNAKVIRMIARDENIHLLFTQRHLNRFTQEDPDFVKIKKELMMESTMIFMEAAQQEKDWAKYLFKDGEMLGLNEEICCRYVDWITDKRMKAVGLNYLNDVPDTNPLPWTESWIKGNDKQLALQETENDSYLLGILKGSVSSISEESRSTLERRLNNL